MESEYNALYEYCENVMLYDKVLKFINENALILPGTTVIAAVSGGADSVCLLDLLYNLKEKLCFNLECAHFNHNIRGEESDGDETFVRKLCETLKIPLHVGSAQVLQLCGGTGIEDAARRARYGFFKTLTEGKNAVIATAHTQNDNVETFFINLLRGSGTRGLCAVPVKRDGVIRPMLEVTREEIIEHLCAVGLDFRTDSTNADCAYLRNFIRLKVLPLISSRPELDLYGTVSRAVKNLRADSRALDEMAEKSESDSIESLKQLPDALLWRVLTKKLEKEYDIILDSVHFDAVKSLLYRNSSKEQIRGDVYAVTCNGRLTFERIESIMRETAKLAIGENNYYGKRILIKNVKEVYNRLTNAYIDCDKIGNDLYADNRREGDRFYTVGRNSTSQLKKLLKADKVPLAERDLLTVIRNENKDIVFVEGYGVDKRFAADKNSKRIICIEII